jgi:hypothetical protein
MSCPMIYLDLYAFSKGPVCCLCQEADLEKAQLGLGHSYSRAKVKFNVNRVDNMIIQAISLLDTLDKDINTFCMRVRYCRFHCDFFLFKLILYIEGLKYQSIALDCV